MLSIPARIWLRRFRGVLFLGALSTGQILLTAHASDASRATSFVGQWKYKQTCGYQHSATVTLTQAGAELAGAWTDGTRLNGSDGSLKGRVHDGKLYVRYCGNDEQAGYALCPRYEAEETDYFIRRGDDLIWYQASGEGDSRTFEKYVVLHRFAEGEKLPVDNHCNDDDN